MRVENDKRALTTKLRVEIENEMKVFLESLNFEIKMRVSQKSANFNFFYLKTISLFTKLKNFFCKIEGILN